MNKTIDVICLLLWLLQIVIAIMAMFELVTVTSWMYLGAVIVCASHYVDRLIHTK